MSNAYIKDRDNMISRSLVDFRNSKAWSQAHFAKRLGVSRVTINRWENGETKPSTLAIKQLEELMGSNLNLTSLQGEPLPTKKRTPTEPSPYVLNGPKDQNDFHSRLIDMQHAAKVDKRRLSLVKSINGEFTAQYKLENPSETAKSWSSNYGPHGWHRYVGRFPPHLVRALINYFGATQNDIICDPFMGSGTTIVESRLLGIPSVGIEVCPLSCLISRTKSTFPESTEKLYSLINSLEEFYNDRMRDFGKKNNADFTHQQILKRKGNNIASFTNIERWFTPEALLGVSIVTEFAAQLRGYEQDLILTALSAKMRSIGNVDVDVIRAEYSKKPRKNVDVLKLVKNQLLKMLSDIENTIQSHSELIANRKTVIIKEGSVLDTDIPRGSISHIITSPPYGVESLSYLRTHLLSYRTLAHFLETDPYEFSKKVIGSEYLLKEIPDVSSLSVAKISKTYRSFFEKINDSNKPKNFQIRVGMMMHFFQDMTELVDKFSYWIKQGGQVAFVVGNKRIEDEVIPTDSIISEIFVNKGFKLQEVLGHKLKTNNSNSKVPWQDRIIDQEFTMIFKKK